MMALWTRYVRVRSRVGFLERSLIKSHQTYTVALVFGVIDPKKHKCDDRRRK
jgi:hypothetical protein